MSDASAWVVVLDPAIEPRDLERVSAAIHELAPGPGLTQGDAWAAMAFADGRRLDEVARLRSLPGVSRVVAVSAPYRLASREVFDEAVPVRLGADAIEPGSAVLAGGEAPILVMVCCRASAGSWAHFRAVAEEFAEAGARMLGLGKVGEGHLDEGSDVLSVADLDRARDIAAEVGLRVSAELSDARQLEEVSPYVDLLEVGGSKMQDFNFLRELGRAERPVLLHRGPGSTVEEFLLAAEYVLTHGNGRVLLCESGIRTFGSTPRPRFEINAIPVIRRSTHLPILADVSHATTNAAFASAIAKAAVAAGADGVVLQVVLQVDQQREGEATLDVETFREMSDDLRSVAAAVGRRL